MKYLCWLFMAFLLTTLPNTLVSQDSEKTQVLEVVVTTHDVSRTETLIYIRVYSDGSAEAHPTREVDFRNLVLKHAQIPPSEMVALQESLSPSRTQNWDSKYARFWGNKDFGDEWTITLGDGNQKKEIRLVNFRPFLARVKKRPYPTDIEKLGCTIWELRAKVVAEPLEKDYLSGCRNWVY